MAAKKLKSVQKTLTGKKPAKQAKVKKAKAKKTASLKKQSGKRQQKKTAKKDSKSSKNSRLLKKVPKEYYFILLGGKQIKSLPELALEIENMADEIFYHHVNEAKNDFANWIKDIIGEIELADQLMNINTKKDMQLRLLKHIVQNL